MEFHKASDLAKRLDQELEKVEELTATADPFAEEPTYSELERAEEPELSAQEPEYYQWEHPLHFVTGPAGCGKTFLTRERVKQSRPNTCVLMASTGIAAVNMGDAVTINSQLGYFDTKDLQSNYTHGYLTDKLRRMRRGGVQRLILDEVSMTEGEQLTVLCRALDELNTESEVKLGHASPIGLTVVGDFLQLPPVQGKFAFESPEWHRFIIERMEGIKRTVDPAFIQALRAARTEDVQGVMDYFGPRLNQRTDPGFTGTTILAKNIAVDRMNKMRHDELPGTTVNFDSQRWGQPRGEWKQIPATLELKPQAQVMILANRYEASPTDSKRELLYANGDNAVFLGKDEHGNATVLLERNGDLVDVKWVTRENKRYLKEPRFLCANEQCGQEVTDGRTKRCPLCGGFIKKVAHEVVGEVTYMPLRLAYASTVHKTQGLTLDKVQVVIADPFFSSPGMLYVALSRARDPEKLRVVGSLDQLRARCRMDPAVRGWR